MPLSEHEQRMFAEIQRQLVEEDPRFVTRTRRTLRAWSPDGRLRVAIALGSIGLVGVLALTFDLLFGVAGMALVLVALILGVGAVSDRSLQHERGTPPDAR
jgi:ABC-type branched-subunit amino acid transport system permease subunit